MVGPEKRERPSGNEQAPAPPPGDFLSAELQSDCARFLEDVRSIVRQREEAALHPAPRLG